MVKVKSRFDLLMGVLAGMSPRLGIYLEMLVVDSLPVAGVKKNSRLVIFFLSLNLMSSCEKMDGSVPRAPRLAVLFQVCKEPEPASSL